MPSGRVISFRPSTKSSPVRGLSTSTVQDMVPSVPVLGSFSANIASTTGEAPSPLVREKSPARPLCSCSTRHFTICAKADTTEGMRLRSPVGGKGMSKASSPPLFASAPSFIMQPRVVVGAHVHRQRLRHGTEAARLLAAVDPHLEGVRAASILDVADEHREAVLRVLDHVGPRRVAVGEVGPPRPAQRRQHRRRHRFHREAAVDVVLHEVLRLLHREHRAEHLVGTVGREPLEPRFPGVEIEVLEIRVGIVLGHVDRLRDAGVDERRDRGHHLLVRARRDLERGDEIGRQRARRHLRCRRRLGSGARRGLRRCTPSSCRRACASCACTPRRTAARCRWRRCRRRRG